MELQAKKSFLIEVLYLFIIVGLIVIVSKFLIYNMFPFILSLLVAALSQKPAGYLSRKTGIKKSIFAVIISAFIYIGVGATLIFLIYRLILSSAGLIDYLPQVFSQISIITQKIENWFSVAIPSEIDMSFNLVLEDIFKSVASFLAQIIKNTISAAPSFLVSSIVALVAACYISKDYDGLSKFAKAITPKSVYNRFLRVKTIFKKSVLKMFYGYIILMFLTFLQLWLGFWVLGIKQALILAIIIAVIDILPVLGTGTVLIPWAIYLAFTNNVKLSLGIAFLYIIIVLIRNFAEPKIVSQQMGINPLFTLFSMYLGLKLFGGVGVILLPIIFIVTVKYYKEEY